MKLFKNLARQITTIKEKTRLMNSPSKKFWKWFEERSEIYFHFEKNTDKLFDMLKNELSKIHPELVFEFSHILDDGTREFVISADGITDYFPLVIDLVDQAPHLKNWKIIALRQPHKDITHIHYKELIINLDDVFFRYEKDNDKIGLELNFRGFNGSDDWRAASFLLLDNILGEYLSEMKISYVKRKELNESDIPYLLPIRSLPMIIDDHL